MISRLLLEQQNQIVQKGSYAVDDHDVVNEPAGRKNRLDRGQKRLDKQVAHGRRVRTNSEPQDIQLEHGLALSSYIPISKGRPVVGANLRDDVCQNPENKPQKRFQKALELGHAFSLPTGL